MYNSYGSYGRYAMSAETTTITLILSLGLSVLMITAQWRLFTKAGEPGWKCLIPFYGAYVFYKLVWTPGAFFVMLALATVTGLLAAVPVLMLIASAIVVILTIVTTVKTARAYGKGGGFAVGLIFLAPIVFPILAFGDSEYVGPSGIPAYRGSTSDAGFSGVVGKAPFAGTDSAAGGDVHADDSRNLPWAAAAILGVPALLTVGSRLYMAMTKFTPMRGLLSSPFVGMENFQRLLRASTIGENIKCTLIFLFIGLALAVVFGFIGTAAGRGSGRSVMIGLGMALAATPRLFWEASFISLGLLSQPGTTPMIFLLQALPWAGLSMFAGALLSTVWPNHRAFAALTVPVLMLFASASIAGAPFSPVYTALNRSATMSLNCFSYQHSYMMANYSLGAAVESIRGLITLLCAIPGLLLLVPMLRSHGVELADAPQSASAAPAALLAGLLPLAVGIAMLITGGTRTLTNDTLTLGLLHSALEFILTLILGFGLYFGLLSLAGRFSRGGAMPVGLSMLFAMALGAFSIVGYLLAHTMGVGNTLIPVIFSSLLNPLSFAFAFVLVLTRPADGKARALLALGAALFAACFGLGNYEGSIIHVSSNSSRDFAGVAFIAMRNMETLSDTSAVLNMQAPSSILASLAGLSLVLSALPAAFSAMLSTLGERANRTK